ncbi:hypothetical protein E2I00_011234, partial [Balaenoptera physalus]
EQQPSWTDDLPLCHLSGVGSASNRSYSADGKGTESHPPEDNWLKFRSENNCFLYGVFNGYDGNRAFDVVERSFLESIDDALAEKASLQSQLPEYQKILERLKMLEKEISGGAMAVVAVLLNNRLYVANVGTNRALLCKSTVDGLQVTQLNVDHTTENEDELFRLSQLGLDAGKIKQVGVICGQESTRRIGDYKEIAAMIDTEFAKQTSLDAVAQAVVDRGPPQPRPVAHHSLPPKAAGGRVYPVSVPYSSAQSTSKTSVTLSLVMPSQGQLVNGAHSASTLDEATPTLTKTSGRLALVVASVACALRGWPDATACD